MCRGSARYPLALLWEGEGWGEGGARMVRDERPAARLGDLYNMRRHRPLTLPSPPSRGARVHLRCKGKTAYTNHFIIRTSGTRTPSGEGAASTRSTSR